MRHRKHYRKPNVKPVVNTHYPRGLELAEIPGLMATCAMYLRRQGIYRPQFLKALVINRKLVLEIKYFKDLDKVKGSDLIKRGLSNSGVGYAVYALYFPNNTAAIWQKGT